MAEWPDTLKGTDGQTPYIGENGNWFIGEEDTGILADVEQAVESKISEMNYIIETGNNENGHYHKYTDGTLEMWGRIELTSIPIKAHSGILYNSIQKAGTFPIASVSDPTVHVDFSSSGGVFPILANILKNGFRFWLYADILQDATGILTWHAWGTWK